MSLMKLKPGDWVVCVNASAIAGRTCVDAQYLTEGKRYKVEEYYEGIIRVMNDSGYPFGYYQERFVRAAAESRRNLPSWW